MSSVSPTFGTTRQSHRGARGGDPQSDTALQGVALAWMQRLVLTVPGHPPRSVSGHQGLGETDSGAARIRLHSDAGVGRSSPASTEASAGQHGLAQRIYRAIFSDSGASPSPWNPWNPQAATSLQRLLDAAVNGLPRTVLLASPDLLAAVRAGFQTEGGRQFAFDTHLIDASLVGDFSQPLATPGAVQPHRRLTQTDARAQFDATFDFDDKIPIGKWAPVERIVRALADNSPSFRNVMARARALNAGRPLSIRLDPQTLGARISPNEGTIWLGSMDDPRRAASWVVFEANNGSMQDAFVRNIDRLDQRVAAFTPQQEMQLDQAGARIVAGGLYRSPAAATAYVNDQLRQPGMLQEVLIPELERVEAQQPTWTVQRQQEHALRRAGTEILQRAWRHPESVMPYIERTFDTPEKRFHFRSAVEFAFDRERTELQATTNHHQIFDELRAGHRTVPLSAAGQEVLTDAALAEMDMYDNLPHIQQGLEQGFHASIDVQVRIGHAAMYLDQGLVLRELPPMHGEVPAVTQDDLAGPATWDDLAGFQAGRRARASAGSAVDEHGSKGDPAAARAAVEASLRKESLTLAERIVASPEMAGVVKVLGKAATAAMVLQLAEAIYTDVASGDHEAHATR
ncbi:MAG: hypothetical protein V4739_16470, partial [Pseudomonadota bacterium]